MLKSRKALVTAIHALAEPKFHDSGYVKHIGGRESGLGRRPLRLWAPGRPIELDGFVLQSLYAVTEDGLITDATGGGAMIEDYDCFPVEDLQLLHKTLMEVMA
jgi:hypothetical protein